MIFNSLTFLLYFLPLSVIACYFVNVKYRKIILLFFSILFYVLSDIKSFPIILMLIIINYLYAKFHSEYHITNANNKFFFVFVILWNILILIFFKFNKMPLGLSFIIFNILSLHIDYFKNREEYSGTFIDFFIYILFFGKILQGPIVKYKNWYKEQFEITFNPNRIALGIENFILALAIKCILCTNIMDCMNYINVGNFSYCSMVLYQILFVVYLYLDFYSYSKMAISIGLIFNYDIPDNFNYPLCAVSLTDFWRKWHMTLSYWFRDYVYINMGGNRKGIFRTIFNLLVVWILTGLWHGFTINFVLWGLCNFVVLFIEKYIFRNKIGKIYVINHIWTVAVVLLSFVLFEYENIADIIETYQYLLFMKPIVIENNYWHDILNNYIVWIIISVVCVTPIFSIIYKFIREKLYFIAVILNIILLIISISYIVSSSYSPFVYIKF